MAQYDRQVASALRMIKKYGQSVTWRSLTNGTLPDPNKPWLVGATQESDKEAVIAFFPRDKENEYTKRSKRDANEVTVGDCLGYMGRVEGYVPQLKDIVIRGSATYTVERLDIIRPNGEDPILYTIEFGAGSQ